MCAGSGSKGLGRGWGGVWKGVCREWEQEGGAGVGYLKVGLNL